MKKLAFDVWSLDFYKSFVILIKSILYIVWYPVKSVWKYFYVYTFLATLINLAVRCNHVCITALCPLDCETRTVFIEIEKRNTLQTLTQEDIFSRWFLENKYRKREGWLFMTALSNWSKRTNQFCIGISIHFKLFMLFFWPR